MIKCFGVQFDHDTSKCQHSNIEKQLQKQKRALIIGIKEIEV